RVCKPDAAGVAQWRSDCAVSAEFGSGPGDGVVQRGIDGDASRGGSAAGRCGFARAECQGGGGGAGATVGTSAFVGAADAADVGGADGQYQGVVCGNTGLADGIAPAGGGVV